ncbi:putative serine hydrolase [Martiniozyma asiatica (nom. inval.)]|nr:putative serine hydrolase [Martiniozyma asiatica]
MSQKAVKGTVLCLHGFAQNGTVFSVKASGIRKALKKAGYHTVFVDGPITLTAADLPFEASKYGADDKAEDLNFRGWVYTQAEKYDLKPCFDTVKNAYKEHGPFIGVLGFSQGAGVTGTILSNFNEIVDDDKALDALKFAMFYSGFIFDNPSAQKYYEKKIEIPTLHIMGELDTLVSNERSQKFADLCKDATVLKHPGGHYCPSTKDLLKTEVAWVNSVVDGTRAKEQDDEDDIQKLSEMMDNLGKA